jgi:Ca2+-binding EF-hand superfamily protein
MRKVLRKVKVVFHEFEDKSKGGLNFEGLHSAMLKLHDNISRDEVVELFQFVDIDSSKVIELKEFLVALTVGYVIDAIPTFKHLRRGSNVGPLVRGDINANSGMRQGSRTNLNTDAVNSEVPLSEADELKNMLNYIVTAYLLFDPEGKGSIQKSSLEKWFEEGGEKTRKNMDLTEQLWQTMVSL